MSEVVVLKHSWTLGEPIGAGGFGQVFAASDGETDAVVKLVPKDPGADRELLFVDLPDVRNVMPVIDYGEHQDYWALVMPRASMSLREHLDSTAGLVPLGDAVEILKHVCDTLADLDGRVVHRDLKPENILYWDERWHLADFGISRYVEATTAPNTLKYALSPPYAAPERWRDERATVAVDVYSVGIMAFEMCAGRLPFEASSVEAYRELHLSGKPPYLDELPTPMATWIEECLYKSPGARPRPINLRARLDRIGEATSSPGLQALEGANRAEVSRRAEESLRESERRSEDDRRRGLAEAGQSSYRRIGDALRAAVVRTAPAVEQRRVGPSVRVATRDQMDAPRPWELRLSGASLSMTDAHPVPRSGHIDVILAASVSVSSPPQRDGYSGRSHSLWFCDAQEEGSYAWFETAFMTSALMGGTTSVTPYSCAPSDAQEALSGVMGGRQVAWPFTQLDPGDLEEFIGRWSGWFAEGALGSLKKPRRMPEASPHGSWRRSA